LCSGVTLLRSSSHEPAPTAIYTLSLHDALPIFAGDVEVVGKGVVLLRVAARGGAEEARVGQILHVGAPGQVGGFQLVDDVRRREDRKSTRLNSSHVKISYAVFCLKKKKQEIRDG